jgi:2-oxoglutarate ferredoxin oxidoreductase subunit beta
MTAHLEPNDYRSGVKPTWCPGCGDYSVLAGVQAAMSALDLDPSNVLFISGIGCSSNLPHFLKCYGIHGIHGRTLPIATGAKLANPDLTVIAVGGDGDGYGIGMGHLVHAMRRNINITYVTMDNQIYGLTTGQSSPTSMMGHRTKSSPGGSIESPVNPISIAISAGATFIARGFSGDVKMLGELLTNGIRHRGFSLVDVLSPCVTFNHLNTYDWFRKRVYDLQAEGHDASNVHRAFEKALEFGDRIPIGLFYRTQRPTYEEFEPVLRKGAPTKRPLGWKNSMKEDILGELQ